MATKKEAPELPETVDPNIAVEEETIIENPDIAQPVKRGRGRPCKTDAEKAAGKDSPKKSKARVAQDTEELGSQLVGLHKLAALMTGLPELEISSIEGQMLAGGINAVCQEYGLSLGGKTGAAIQLIGALGIVYMPRLVVIQKRMQAEHQKAEENRTVDVNATVADVSNASAFN